MENLVYNVKDLASGDRQALEHVLGTSLREDQQLWIQVHTKPSGVSPQPNHDRAVAATSGLPDWCHVYAGLSDEQIADLEKIVLTRADLTRAVE